MPAPLKKKPVLIVEDDLDLSVTLARALETAGYEVTAVADYRQASFKLIAVAIHDGEQLVVFDIAKPVVRVSFA